MAFVEDGVKYQVRVYDTGNRRVAAYDEVPLLEMTRTAPDMRDWIKGLLPGGVTDLGHGYRIEIVLDGQVFGDALVTAVNPQWSDTRKLILDRFVDFHEVIEFEAERVARDGNTQVSRGYTNRTVGQIVRAAINSASGAVHYLVDHTVYPDGAVREYQKFLARKTAGNELEVGGISTGQWVDGGRIDASGASAKDGDTIQGLKVDGVDWPDLRMMLIDCEETSKNSHAIKLHPEIANWTTGQYDASGYKVKADAATAFLQSLMDTKGIDCIELNPHRDATGAFDDRVDVYGRYLGLVYGGGECFNAGLVEKGHARVYLYDGGKYHVPELELKDFFSYEGVNAASVEDPAVSLVTYDVSNGIFEVLTALAYVADGFVWSVDPDLAVHFGRVNRPDRVVFYDPLDHSVTLGSDSDDVANAVYFDGNPFTTAFSKSYYNNDSIDEYGFRYRFLDYFSMSREADADLLVGGLLKDIAYPEASGAIEFLSGDASIRVGELVEFRGGALRRLEREVAGEWDDRFTGKLVGRVKEVRHRFRGERVTTTARLTSPFRSVGNPLSFIVRSQPGASTLFQFRLDEATVGLDLGYHLD